MPSMRMSPVFAKTSWPKAFAFTTTRLRNALKLIFALPSLKRDVISLGWLGKIVRYLFFFLFVGVKMSVRKVGRFDNIVHEERLKLWHNLRPRDSFFRLAIRKYLKKASVSVPSRWVISLAQLLRATLSSAVPKRAAFPRTKFLIISVGLSFSPRLLMVSNNLNASLASLTSRRITSA